MEEQKRKSGMTGMERNGRSASEGETGRQSEPSHSSGSSIQRGTAGMESEESPRPVTSGSQSETGSGYSGDERRSTGTTGPTTQMERKGRGRSEQSESSFR